MRRGWEVEFADGTVIKETQMDWKKVPKQGLIRVTLHYDGRRWDLHNKIAYDQKKRGSCIPGVPSSFQVESRSVGYYDQVEGRTMKVWYTVNEWTGKMNMEVEDL